MQKKVLIIAFVWPEPDTTAAGNRMMQLLHFFLEQHFEITIASTAIVTEHSFDFESLGIGTTTIRLNHRSFDEFVAHLDPQIVLFDRFLTEEQFGWRVAQFAPNALRILDTEDLHSLRHTREVAFKKGITFTTAMWLNEGITKREIASIYRSDISLMISSYEMHLLKNIINIDECILWHLPFLLDELSEQQITDWPSFKERTDFIYIGNGKHAPNIDAVLWLKKEIWPLIRKEIPTSTLNIYGAYLPPHITQMHNPKEGFLIQGWAAHKEKVFKQARVNLAPLRFGAGIKGKLIDAMQAGTPSVTTSIGAEGMHDDLEWSGTKADTAEDFADAAIALYADKTLWHACQQNGAAIVNELYSKEKFSAQLAFKMNAVQEDLEKHRLQNFTGSLLQHQTMASTKYMSKWIEEKALNA